MAGYPLPAKDNTGTFRFVDSLDQRTLEDGSEHYPRSSLLAYNNTEYILYDIFDDYLLYRSFMSFLTCPRTSDEALDSHLLMKRSIAITGSRPVHDSC